MVRTYTELSKLKTFEERFAYLQLNGQVGEATFGFDRFVNQAFYRSPQWKMLRAKIIVRDNGCDLGIEGREIFRKPLIHHMNPINLKDILDQTEYLLNPDYLITVSHDTHNAIHYGDESLLIPSEPVVRQPYDTCPWRKGV
jgi:hypothetical protein